MNIQGNALIKEQVAHRFKKNSNSSFSAAFRFYRRHNCYTSIGDYPILASIIDGAALAGIKLKRNKLLYALNQSDEFKNEPKKEKMELLEELLKP